MNDVQQETTEDKSHVKKIVGRKISITMIIWFPGEINLEVENIVVNSGLYMYDQ